jgi:hypothetical protein
MKNFQQVFKSMNPIIIQFNYTLDNCLILQLVLVPFQVFKFRPFPIPCSKKILIPFRSLTEFLIIFRFYSVDFKIFF